MVTPVRIHRRPLKWYTKLWETYKRCTIVFQGHPFISWSHRSNKSTRRVADIWVFYINMNAIGNKCFQLTLCNRKNAEKKCESVVESSLHAPCWYLCLNQMMMAKHCIKHFCPFCKGIGGNIGMNAFIPMFPPIPLQKGQKCFVQCFAICPSVHPPACPL